MNHYENKRKHFFLPVNTGYVEKGVPNDQYIEFYENRSGHGIYCVIVGNVVIPNGFPSNSVCAEISDSTSWNHLTKTITARGARAGIQLSTTWRNYKGIKRFNPIDVNNYVSEYKTILSDYSPNDILKVFENLRRGIDLSVSAGFTHIQIHAAHGYLFSLLIDETFCKYSELALLSLHDVARELNSANIESSIRLSLITGENNIDRNRSIFINKIFDLPFSFFDISFGFYNINKHLIYPNSKDLLDERIVLSLALANQFPNKQVILSGKSFGLWHSSLPINAHIGICRDLIANPNFLRDQTKGCIGCMKCHYYSNNELSIKCDKW